MRRTAGSPAADGSGRTKEAKGPVGPNAKLASIVGDAWRLAFVVVADEELATRAVTKAFVDASLGDASSLPSRVELLEATLRISLTRAAESSDSESNSAVTAALWQLGAEQRAALWLATVSELDNSALGAVLGLTAPNAGHVATRAAEWLDVALDHESGPLCEFETELADFAGGELPPAEAEELEDHLPGCPTCRTKLRAREELSDLKSVLAAAVPEPPKGLDIEALELEERSHPGNGEATLADGPPRTPAVRPLAACCAALLIVALLGVGLMRPHRQAGPVSTSDPHAIQPSLPNSSANSGLLGSSSNLPPATATTITVTTSSLPALTFPTIPGRKGKP